MDKYEILTNKQLVGVVGGKGWGWIGLLDPAWEFIQGIGNGFMSALKKDK